MQRILQVFGLMADSRTRVEETSNDKMDGQLEELVLTDCPALLAKGFRPGEFLLFLQP